MMTTKPIIICTILFVLGASEAIQPPVEIGNFGDDVMRDDFNPLAEFETNSSPQRKKPKTSGGFFDILSREEKEKLFEKMWVEKRMAEDPYKPKSYF